MDRYIGTKIIQAKEMDAATAGIELDRSINTENSPAGEGYLVEYPDGYRSWSPKKAFEDAYRKCTDMTFGLAIEAAKKGHKIARRGWNGKNMFIVYMEPLFLPPFNTQGTARKVNDRTARFIGADKPLDCQPYFAMYNAKEQWIPGWLASQTDMLSEDWFVVE